MKTGDQKIIPHLWFNDKAEEAVEFYTSIFKNSGRGSISRYPDAGHEVHGRDPGSVMTVEFELEEFRMIALNGGPHFKLNPSISLFVLGDSGEEISRLWNFLIEGGEEMMPLDRYDWSPSYGWLKDKYGISWQLMLEEKSSTPERIIPCFFFTGKQHKKAEAAIRYYTTIFRNSEIDGILKYGQENSYATGGVMHAQFKLEGQTFMAMDSGVENDFPFNEALSLLILCHDQEEIDYYWKRLGAGGDARAQQCGWLKDKFGISWQVVPVGMDEYLKNPETAEKAFGALMSMKKIQIEKLQNAVEQL